MMVEGGANGLPESLMIEAIELAHAEIKSIVAKIRELQSLAGKPKRAVKVEEIDPVLTDEIRRVASGPIRTVSGDLESLSFGGNWPLMTSIVA